LGAARTEGLRGLRDRCRRVRAAACPDAMERHRAIHASRYLRHWTDVDGAARLDARGTPEAIAEVLSALEPFEAEVFRAARAEGRREGFDAYRLDALVAMARATRTGGAARGERAGTRHTVHVVIDHAALLRGTTAPGERSEIDGVGPVPVGVVRSMMNDAFVDAVLGDGVAVARVAHLGGGPPPISAARSWCATPSAWCPAVTCGWAWRSTTSTPGARRASPGSIAWPGCRFHHGQKTHEGYRLEGRPGHWRWLGPDGTQAAPRPPPPPPGGAAIDLDDDTGTIEERRARIYEAALARAEALFGYVT
jgi:hypothetical protein